MFLEHHPETGAAAPQAERAAMIDWKPIDTMPPPGERPGMVWVIVEGSQFHSDLNWYRQRAGLARTNNDGFDARDISAIEAMDLMDAGTGRVTHWLPIELPPYPKRR